MMNVEILTKAIEKAIAGGWVRKRPLPNLGPDNLAYDALKFGIPYANTIIFNHDFAKALWGEDTRKITVTLDTHNVRQEVKTAYWQYHLQQMVIAEDPIEYLGSTI